MTDRLDDRFLDDFEFDPNDEPDPADAWNLAQSDIFHQLGRKVYAAMREDMDETSTLRLRALIPFYEGMSEEFSIETIERAMIFIDQLSEAYREAAASLDALGPPPDDHIEPEQLGEVE